MNFSMHRETYLKNNKIIKIFILLNILIFIGVLIIETKTWNSRMIIIACCVICGIILKFFWKKAIMSRESRLHEVEKLYGKESIVCYAENYFGLVRRQKYGYLFLMTLYLGVLLYVCLMIYSEWLSSTLILGMLGIAHFLLAIPVMIVILKTLETAVFFTSNTLFLSHSNAIDLEKIKKYQFIEHLKGGAILELNTGDQFVRLSLDEKEHYTVKELITNLLIN